MTHRDRAGDPPGRREAAGDAGHIGKAFRRPHRFARCRFACATGTAVSQGFRAAHGFEMGAWLPMSRIAVPRACSPKALGNRLYESISRTFGINQD